MVDFDESAMFGSETPANVNIKASYKKFEAMLIEETIKHYPDVEVDVLNGYGTIFIDGEKDHEVRPALDQILHNVWSKFDWIIETKRGGSRPGAGRPKLFQAKKGDFLILERQSLKELNPFHPPEVVKVLNVTEQEIEVQNVTTEAIITLRFVEPDEVKARGTKSNG